MNYFSFDIFDTLITRKTATPEGIFLHMQEHLQQHNDFFPPELIDNFTKYRIEAEQISRLQHSTEEITLTNIYTHLCTQFKLNETLFNILYSLEIEIEMQYIAPIVENVNKLNLLDPKMTIFISDMYLPKEVVIELLAISGINIQSSQLFLSSDIRYTKRTGTLFEHVLKSLNINPNQLNHFGDNAHSDYMVPKKLGIKTTLYKNIQFNEFEKLLFKNTFSFTEQLIVGGLRYLRINNSNSNYLNALTFGSLPFYFYALWIVQFAKNQNIKHLYFISRDGQTLKMLVDMILKNMDHTIQTHYFYSSRYASYLGNVPCPINTDNIELFFPISESENLNTIIEKLKLESFRNRIRDMKLYPPTQRLTHTNIKHVLTSLFADIEINTAIQNYFSEQKELVKKYYQQIGIFDDSEIRAIIDIGWMGTTFSSITHVIPENAKNNLYGLYFGMKSTDHSFYQKNIFSFYTNYFDQKYLNANLLEFLLSADHESVIGYKTGKEGITPLFRQKGNNIDDQMLSSFRMAYMDFTACLLKQNKYNSIFLSESLHILGRAFSLIKNPHLTHIKEFKNIPFSSNISDTQPMYLIRNIGLLELLNLHLRNKELIVGWKEGSFSISPFYIQQTNRFLTFIRPYIKRPLKLILRRLL